MLTRLTYNKKHIDFTTPTKGNSAASLTAQKIIPYVTDEYKCTVINCGNTKIIKTGK